MGLLAGDLPEAEAALRKAVQLSEDGPSISTQSALAYALCLRGSSDEARRVLDEIDGDLPGTQPAIEELYFAGKCHARLGNTARARTLFQESVRRWPKHPWSTEMQEWLARNP